MERWIVSEVDNKKIIEFSDILGVKPIISQILFSRGITTIKEAKRFLNPNLSELSNPFTLNDMEKCVERIRKAIANKEKILIFGDRDVDGITSIAIIYRILKILGAENILWYIPSEEGYGLNNAIVEKYKKEHNISLIITVDCGVSNFSEIEFAKSLDIDVIVTDHHEPTSDIPRCIAVVNPKLSDSKYVTRDLAGCGVAFKVAHALLFSYSQYYNEEFVAIDVETTGLHPEYSEICEVGAVITKNGLIREQFQSLIRPIKPMPPEVTAIHGITDEMCESALSHSAVLSKLRDFIGKRRLLIHNAPFDLSFLKVAFKKTLNINFNNEYIDTLQMSRQFFPFKSHSLTSLITDLGIEVPQHHRALSDAIACATIFWRLQEMSDARIKYFLEEHLDLVALGTLADLMPLVAENRILVKRGLEILPRTKKPGIKKILSSVLEKRNTLFINSKYVTWNITPLLNAAGRLGKADVACNLLLSSKNEDAERFYDEVCRLNINRKELQGTNIERFMELLSEQCDIEKDKILVVTADDVEHGVTGIVASHIVRVYKKPAILFVVKNDIAHGVGRSINGFDMLKAIEKLSELLLKYGGHRGAVGLTLNSDNLSEFKKRILEIADKEITTPPETTVKVDAVLSPKQINLELLKQLEQLEPFGVGNPDPVFLISGLKVDSHSKFGNNSQDLRVKLSKNGTTFTATGWGLADLDEILDDWRFVDVIAHVESNMWREKEYIQLQLLGIRKNTC